MIKLLLFKLSLAWKNLIRNKKRFLPAIGSVTLTVFLMFSQLGFNNAFLDSSVEFIRLLNTDLIVSNKNRYVTVIERTFDRNKLYRLKGFEGIEAVYPLYITRGNWKNKQTKKGIPIRVFAFNTAHPVFQIEEVRAAATALQTENTLLIDRRSRREYGFDTLEIGDFCELSNRRFKIVGEFKIGSDFATDGNLIMSDLNFLRTFATTPSGFRSELRPNLDNIDLGLIKVSKGTDINQLVKELNMALLPDLIAYTKGDFMKRDRDFYSESSPIGFIFGLGVVIGFVVGVVVVYNIIYTDIEDNLPQYATLRAMGYSSSYLLTVVFLQSVIISILGFFPGLLSSVLVYELISNIAGLVMRMKISVIILVFLLTVGICVVAGFIAARKLRNIDPAEIYA
ncbi:MAG: ABC transporter permease DevC [Xenococcaceae cyanobacterium]